MPPDSRHEHLHHRIEELEEQVRQLKKTETEVIRINQRFREMAETINEVFWLFDWTEQRVIYASPAYEDIWGRSLENLYKHMDEWLNSIHPVDRDSTQQSFNNIVHSGGGEFRQYRIIRPDGTIRWISDRGYPVKDEAGTVVRIAGVARDITEQRVQHRILKQSEERYRALVEDMPILICRFLSDGTLTFVNTYYCKYFQKTRNELLGQSFFTLIPENERARVLERIQSLDRENPSVTYQHHAWNSEGELVWQEWTDRALFNDQGELTEYQSIGQDITRRKEAEQAHRASEARLLKAQRIAHVGDWELDLQTGSAVWSRELRRIFGVSQDVKGSVDTLMELIQPGDRERVRKAIDDAIDGERSYDLEYRIVRPDGETRVLRSMGRVIRDAENSPLRMIGIAQDITEHKQLEDQFHQAQKMEAVGTLAGGIAHNFNNLLTAIQGNASLMLMDLSPDHAHHDRLKSIEAMVESGASLANRLLGFAQGGAVDIGELQPNSLLSNTLEIFAAAHKSITVATEFQSGVSEVLADPNQLEQVFMNLFINAAQAMANQGTLRVRTTDARLDERSVQPHDVPPGQFVKIEVSDTGIGIDSETQERVFDPFFTTRDIGEGSGLGLASAYGIIQSHGGFITVKSEPGQGSTFTVFLPAMFPKVSARSSGPTEQDEKRTPELSGGESIMMIDDDLMVTSTGRALLEYHGYSVSVANSGKEALQILDQTAEPPDLIILDIVMPKMDGHTVMQKLQKNRPEIKVLLATGYPIKRDVQSTYAQGYSGIIRKPFKPEELISRIRAILDEEN